MAKSNSYESLVPKLYFDLKDKIVSGTISQEETLSLHEAFNKIPGGYSTIGQVSSHVLEQLYAEKTPEENVHKFVKQLVEAEKETLNKSYPIDEKMDEKQILSRQKQRVNEFFRNSSLAKRAFLIQAVKENFGKEFSESLKNGDWEKAIDSLVSLKVPEKIRENLSIIKEFYTENNQGIEFNTNYIFHTLGTVAQTHLNQGNSNEKNNKDIIYKKAILDITFNLKDDSTSKIVDKQITGEQLTKEESANLAQKAKLALPEVITKIETKLAEQKNAALENQIADQKNKQPNQKVIEHKKPSLSYKSSQAAQTLTTAINKIKERLKEKIDKGKNITVSQQPLPPKKVKFSDEFEIINPHPHKRQAENKINLAQDNRWQTATPKALKQDNRKWKRATPSNKIEPPMSTPTSSKPSTKGPAI